MTGLIKRVIITAVCLVSVFCFQLGATAHAVPALKKGTGCYKVSIVRSDGGYVSADGRTLGGQLELKSLKRQEYVFKPYEGYELYRVIYDDTDITDCIEDGKYTAEGITHDLTLTVLYRKQENTPASVVDDKPVATEGRGEPAVFVLTAAFSLTVLVFCMNTYSRRNRV